MANNIFSLELSENYLKMAEISISPKQVEIEHLSIQKLNPAFTNAQTPKENQQIADQIKKAAESSKITNKSVAVVIPDAYTYSQIMLMPKLNEKELMSAIRYQADQFIPLSLDEANLDLEVLYEDNTQKKILVLLVAASKQIIEKVQDICETAGLLPHVVENELSSMSRFLTSYYPLVTPNKSTQAIFINLGTATTSVYYYNPELNLIVLNHTFNIGLNLILKEIQINLNIDLNKSLELLAAYQPEQNNSISLDKIITPVMKEFSFEIKRFVNLVSEKYKIGINQLYVYNYSVLFPSISKFIQQNLSINSSEFQPKTVFKNTPMLNSYQNRLSLFLSVVGAGLR